MPNADALWLSPCGRKREPERAWAGEPTAEVGAEEMIGEVGDDDDDGGAKSAVVTVAMSMLESESM